jgi:hypothetical protein
MKFLGNDVHDTSYNNIDGLCEHVELTNPEVDINSLRNKVVAYEECLSDENHDKYPYVYIAIISGEIFVTTIYNALREKLFDEERKLRIALDDYVCTINCVSWSHKVIGEYSNITYEISKNDEENYPMIIIYKDRIHLLSKNGKVSGVINGKYRIFNSSTYTNK